MPKTGFAHSMEEAIAILEETGFPSIIRPSFTLGGSGGGIAYNIDEFEKIIKEVGSEINFGGKFGLNQVGLNPICYIG